MAKASSKGGTVHATRNDVPSNAKSVSIGVLQACLLDAIDLANATRQAHWTVGGPNFIAVHEMLGGFYGDLVTGADDIAERRDGRAEHLRQLALDLPQSDRSEVNSPL